MRFHIPADGVPLWRWVCQPRTMEPQHWRLAVDGQALVLEMGKAKVQELQQALQGLAFGVEDHCIGPDGEELWFWI